MPFKVKLPASGALQSCFIFRWVHLYKMDPISYFWHTIRSDGQKTCILCQFFRVLKKIIRLHICVEKLIFTIFSPKMDWNDSNHSGVNFSIRKSVNYGIFRFSEVAGGGASWAAARVGLRSVFFICIPNPTHDLLKDLFLTCRMITLRNTLVDTFIYAKMSHSKSLPKLIRYKLKFCKI